MSTSQGSCSRTINLLCPSLSKLVRFVALEDHGLDVGTISRTFGIDSSTVRLNGHFVSRGIDLISSVTWRSLLSFFAKRGFSTGNTARDAVIVDGKFRDDSRDGSGVGDEINCAKGDNRASGYNGIGFERKPHLDSFNLLKKWKMDSCNQGSYQNVNMTQVVKGYYSIAKRKLHLEDINLRKKSRTEKSNLGERPPVPVRARCLQLRGG